MPLCVKNVIVEKVAAGKISEVADEELKTIARELLRARKKLAELTAKSKVIDEQVLVEERKKIASYISTAYSSSATINMIANDIARGEHAKIVVLS